MRRTLIALALALACGVGPAWAGAAEDAQATISGQIDSFKARDHGRAFSHAAPGIRLMFRNEANFARMVKRGYLPIYEARSYRFGRNRAVDPTTMYQEVLLTGPSGKAWTALYTMKLGKDGVWKIGGVQLVPGGEIAT